MLTGNGFCLQLCCEQSRVLLRFPELRVLMRKEADPASACQPIRAALQHKRASAERRSLAHTSRGLPNASCAEQHLSLHGKSLIKSFTKPS